MFLFTGFMGWLTSTSLAAGVLAVIILLLKAVFRARLGARWHSAIWLLLYLRLVLPWIPESTFSIFNLLQPGSITQLVQFKYLPAGKQSLLPLTAADSAAPLAAPAPNTPDGRGLNHNWPVLIWLTGAIGVAAYFAIPNLLFARSLRRHTPSSDPRIIGGLERCKQLLLVDVELPVIETRLVTSPVLFGLIRPKLLLPPGLCVALEKEELEHILLHELAHLKRKDLLTNWLINLLLVLHWFNPILWYAFRRARFDQELACDALALAKLPDKNWTGYGLTILQLLRGTVNASLPGALPILGRNDIKRRIRMIQSFKRTSIKWTVVGLVLALLLGGTACTKAVGTKSPAQAAEAVARSYLLQLFTISDYSTYSNLLQPDQALAIAEKYKLSFTQKGYSQFVTNRIFLLPLQTANQGKYNVEVTNLTFKNASVANNKVLLDFEITLKATYPPADSRSPVTGSDTGQISLINENGQWKIDNHWQSYNFFFKR